MMSNVEQDDSADDFLREAARVLDEDHVPPVNSSTLPSAGKTPTTTQREAELAAAVDGGNRVLCTDGMPGQGLPVISPNAFLLLIMRSYLLINSFHIAHHERHTCPPTGL